MEYSRSLSRLQRLCSKAEYCKADVYRKALKDLDGNASEAASLVEELVRDRYVDDARYASAYAREKASIQGWGPVKIRFQLRAKGVGEADISAALEEIDSAAAGSRLERLLQAKARTLQGDPEIRLKLIKFGLSRGYEYSEVNKALGSILKGN
ncbi:MAG: RecX family transcriptional regulator [Bacteroidales bacterium]|nr:RecX family transcriptional regulator [Bacteroidales bacterium]